MFSSGPHQNSTSFFSFPCLCLCHFSSKHTQCVTTFPQLAVDWLTELTIFGNLPLALSILILSAHWLNDVELTNVHASVLSNF